MQCPQQSYPQFSLRWHLAYAMRPKRFSALLTKSWGSCSSFFRTSTTYSSRHPMGTSIWSIWKLCFKDRKITDWSSTPRNHTLVQKRTSFWATPITKMTSNRWDRVDATANFPRPTTIKKLIGFIGTINFYRKLIKGAATHLAPLNHLLAITQSEWCYYSQCYPVWNRRIARSKN